MRAGDWSSECTCRRIGPTEIETLGQHDKPAAQVRAATNGARSSLQIVIRPAALDEDLRYAELEAGCRQGAAFCQLVGLSARLRKSSHNCSRAHNGDSVLREITSTGILEPVKLTGMILAVGLAFDDDSRVVVHNQQHVDVVPLPMEFDGPNSKDCCNL